MRVPDEAGTGNATVTLSYADCEEVTVAPVRVVVPVVEPERKGEGSGK